MTHEHAACSGISPQFEETLGTAAGELHQKLREARSRSSRSSRCGAPRPASAPARRRGATRRPHLASRESAPAWRAHGSSGNSSNAGRRAGERAMERPSVRIGSSRWRISAATQAPQLYERLSRIGLQRRQRRQAVARRPERGLGSARASCWGTGLAALPHAQQRPGDAADVCSPGHSGSRDYVAPKGNGAAVGESPRAMSPS